MAGPLAWLQDDFKSCYCESTDIKVFDEYANSIFIFNEEIAVTIVMTFAQIIHDAWLPPLRE